jgi:hypothetical protein
MADIDDLINKGFILHQPTEQAGRTFIITGLYRSGTSVVAAILQQAGLFIGSDINDIVYEDEEMFRLLSAGQIQALPAIIGARNASHAAWGFKCPLLWRLLTAKQLRAFDAPRLIITWRDPVSVAVRTSLSEYQGPMRALHDAVANQTALMAFIDALECPYLLLSYEKALTYPQDTIDVLLQFCGITSNSGLRARLLQVIELNRTNYLVSARRRFEGLIEGIRRGQLYGWCCLTRSPEPITIDVLVDDAVAVTLVADAPRGDLAEAGIGNGNHGFFVPLETLRARPDSVIRVRVAQHGVELENSGKRLCDFSITA